MIFNAISFAGWLMMSGENETVHAVYVSFRFSDSFTDFFGKAQILIYSLNGSLVTIVGRRSSRPWLFNEHR